MTKLKNKKCLLETIENLQKNEKNFSIAILDMDNFKSINELFGYKTGDEFIVKIGETVAESELDAYRFGGDEFVVLFTQNESEDKQKEIMNNLLENINKMLDSHKAKDSYDKIAQKKINMLTKSDEKIKKLQKDKYGKEILMDLRKNLKTKEAKNDEYLFSKLNSYSESINFTYNNLLNECITNETNEDKKNMLRDIKLKHSSFVGLKNKEIKELDEYFTDVYDKTAHISRLKSSLKDFKKRNGFCATCAIVSFNKENTKNKKPIDLIQETGEILQKSKYKDKGKCYFENIKKNEIIAPSFGKGINVKVISIAQYKNNLNLQKNNSKCSFKMMV